MENEGSGSTQGISTNRYFSIGNGNGQADVYRADIVPMNNVYIKGTFNIPSGLTKWASIVIGSRGNYTSSSRSEGYGLVIDWRSNSNNITIQDHNTTKATGSFDFSGFASGDYAGFEIDIDSNNWTTGYVWNNSTGSKGASVVSFNNAGVAYTPTAAGNQYTFGAANQVGGSSTVYSNLFEVGDLPSRKGNFLAFM